MDIQKVDSIKIDGGHVTINVPIYIDNETAKKFVQIMADDAVTSAEQHKQIITLLAEIKALLEPLLEKVVGGQKRR